MGPQPRPRCELSRPGLELGPEFDAAPRQRLDVAAARCDQPIRPKRVRRKLADRRRQRDHVRRAGRLGTQFRQQVVCGRREPDPGEVRRGQETQSLVVGRHAQGLEHRGQERPGPTGPPLLDELLPRDGGPPRCGRSMG
ncbi:MAG: hypothetical protein ACYSUF_13730 [Planctomycetota bacterium]